MTTESQKNNMKKYIHNKYHNDPEFRKNHLEKMKVIGKITKERNKDKVYDLLGGYQCSCPGENCWHEGKCNIIDKRVLQLDHINSNGRQEEREINLKGSSKYSYYIKNHEKTKLELQVLCSNCNWVKKYNKKEVRK